MATTIRIAAAQCSRATPATESPTALSAAIRTRLGRRQHAGQRPQRADDRRERQPFRAELDAVAGEHREPGGRCPRSELLGQPRLADARLTADEREHRVAAARHSHRGIERRKLLVPADEDRADDPAAHEQHALTAARSARVPDSGVHHKPRIRERFGPVVFTRVSTTVTAQAGVVTCAAWVMPRRRRISASRQARCPAPNCSIPAAIAALVVGQGRTCRGIPRGCSDGIEVDPFPDLVCMFGGIVQGDADKPGIRVRLGGQEADLPFLAAPMACETVTATEMPPSRRGLAATVPRGAGPLAAGQSAAALKWPRIRRA
jgi:hypothetical protein